MNSLEEIYYYQVNTFENGRLPPKLTHAIGTFPQIYFELAVKKLNLSLPCRTTKNSTRLRVHQIDRTLTLLPPARSHPLPTVLPAERTIPAAHSQNRRPARLLGSAGQQAADRDQTPTAGRAEL